MSALTLTEELCGMARPSVTDRERYIAWLLLEHPFLRQWEAEREYLWACIGFWERYGRWPGNNPAHQSQSDTPGGFGGGKA